MKKNHKTNRNKHNRKLKRISDIEKRQFNESFRMFDRQSSGYLSIDDLHHALQLFTHKRKKVDHNHISKEEVKQLMKKIDVDKNGMLTIDEFVEFVQIIERSMKGGDEGGDDVDVMEELYKNFDFQKKNEITPFQLKKSLSFFGIDITKEEAEGVVRRFDSDHTGSLDFKQFSKLMKI